MIERRSIQSFFSLQAQLQGPRQVTRDDRLSDVRTKAALLELPSRVLLRRHGDDWDGCGVRVSLEQPGGLPSIDDWHLEVHQDQVGRMEPCLLDGIAAVVREQDVIVGEDRREDNAVVFLIVCNQDEFLGHERLAKKGGAELATDSEPRFRDPDPREGSPRRLIDDAGAESKFCRAPESIRDRCFGHPPVRRSFWPHSCVSGLQ